MYALVCLILLVAAGDGAQDTNDGKALLQKAESLAHSVKSWRAEIVVTSKVWGNGMDLQSQVRVKIAVQAPLKVRRENSGDDQTVLVCDGTESFYMGDGHNYYRNRVEATREDCDFPLRASYQLGKDPVSVSIIGHDHVVLADGNHACDVVRAEWKYAEGSSIRTMCIDPASGLILRDVTDKDLLGGMRSFETATFASYESNPTFPRDTFKFSIPPGAVEAKPPI